MKTRILLILGILAVGGVLAWYLPGQLSSGVEVETAAAKKDRVWECIDERAKTRLRETYLITMPSSGWIEPITLVEGDRVYKDDPDRPVARVVPDDMQLVVRAAEATVAQVDASITENLSAEVEKLGLEQAVEVIKSMANTVEAARERVRAGKKKLDYAESNMARIARLRSADAATQDELELAELQKVIDEVDFAQDKLVLAAMESIDVATRVLPKMIGQTVADKRLSDAVLQQQKVEAMARLEQLKLDQGRGTITSPVDGVVLQRYVNDRRLMAAGSPLIEVGRLEDLEVEVDVLSTDVVRAKVGQKVEIYGPAVGRRPTDGKDYADGTVAKIYPAGFTKISSLGVEQQRVKLIVSISPQDLDWLRQQRDLGVGYRVRVRIYTAEKPDALAIPRSALFRSANGLWQVYAVSNGRATIRQVQVGLLNDESAEVISGMSEGEQVVLAPQSNLADGGRVSMRTDGPAR
jgi:HlyD family secretion protein